MSGAYRGEGKTDARDARVIADQARMHPRDSALLDTPPELVSTLQVLTNYRADLITDRVRLINRLRDLLVGICPASERAFDCSAAKGPVVMLTEYQTPATLRHARPAPAARDSGRRSGTYHRPKRCNRRLRHIFYMAAQTAMMRPGPSRDYHLKKRAEGLLHTQAVLVLARRRVDVL